MSELRQRRGERPEADGLALPPGDEFASRSKDEVAREAEEMMKKIREGPKPGLSHEAKRFKDELKEDPYNMELIFQLGLAYAKDQQWDKCANVMLRGLKRVNEFESEELRVHFLMTLCQASLSQGKFRQALMVFNEIAEPADANLARSYEALKCFVLCSNGDASAGLKAFHKAVEGEGFDLALGHWALCYPGLQKVGALEVTRGTLEAMATDESMKKRLEMVEMIRELKMNTLKERDQEANSKLIYHRCLRVVALLCVCVFCFLLYHVETSNLQRLKIKT
uniref:Uncharacterized protein n=1 Tax=Alexandrium monilatum TaxID=311494 RepID=A0A7S4UYJ5_9DINO